MSATDADSDAITYSISGPDANLITLSGTNKATALITNPTKTSYAFTMTATDDASATVNSATIDTKKSTSEAVFITGNSSNLVEDSGSYTASGTATTTGLTGTVTYSIASLSNGTVAGTYGSLAFNATTGEYTYTLANDSQAVQELQNVEVADSFVISATDSSGSAKTHTIAVTVDSGVFKFDGNAIASDFNLISVILTFLTRATPLTQVIRLLYLNRLKILVIIQ